MFGCASSWIYRVRPLLGEPRVLDVDATVKPLYGHQQTAEVSYNASKRGRPSHVHRSYLMAEQRLVLEVEAASGKAHTPSIPRRGCGRCSTAWHRPARPPCCAATATGAARW